MMFGMPSLRVDKWMRVGAGFGLLLLLAAQEKVCPWLLAPPSESDPNAAAPQPPQPDGDEGPGKRGAKRLPYVLPDATAPRWPAAWNQTTLRQTTGWHDGVVSCGQRDPSAGGSAPVQGTRPDRWAWHCFLQPVQPRGLIERLDSAVTPTDPAVRTSISRTGPPLG